MKKNEYVAPKMETVEIKVEDSLLISASGDTLNPGKHPDGPDDDED